MRAWGNDGVASKSSFPRRAAAWLWWHYPRGPLDMIGDGLAALDQLLRRMTGRPANPGRKVFPN